MKIRGFLLSVLPFASIPNAFAGVWTQTALVGEVQYASTSEKLYVYAAGNANWTPDGCTTVTAYVDPLFPGFKEMLATVLTAKAMGTSIKFFGDCNTSTGLFTAHSVAIP